MKGKNLCKKMTLKDYLGLGKTDVAASIYEVEDGRKYSGVLKVNSAVNLSYDLCFRKDLRSTILNLEQKSSDFVKETDFELKDYTTKAKIELEPYSRFELMGIAIGGAREIAEKRYADIKGLKMTFAKAEVRLTASVKKLLNDCAESEEGRR